MNKKTVYLSDYLLCRKEFINPKEPRGLWWCKDYADVQAACINAVAKPLDTSWEDIALFANVIREFRYILVCLPAGKEREEIINELLLRFNMPVYIPSDEAWHGCKSVAELEQKGGIRAVERLLHRSIEVTIPGLLDVSEIPDDEVVSKNRTFSGIPLLDHAINGFYGGELSVWTGRRGEGKSTLISQLIPEAVARGQRVCVYSGEMPARDFRTILYQQIAGYRNIYKTVDTETNKEIYHVEEEVVKKINEWIKRRVFITDIKKANAHDEDVILSLFEYAHLNYYCTVFIVDNIMTTALKGEAKYGEFRAQSLFASRLTAFAQRFDVHVHLVAHPRKTNQKNFDADDVSGSGDITNRANNVFRVGRVAEEDVASTGYSAGIHILKNRGYGKRDIIPLDFDPVCRRFYPAGTQLFRQFDWEV